MPISANHARFIKLGAGGSWEEKCIDGKKPTIRLGFNNPNHQACLDGDWEVVKDYYKQRQPKQATKIVNQIKDFYELGSDTIWITFYKRRLYWCFADPKITELAPGDSRLRQVSGKWNCTDTKGAELLIDSLSGRLTKVIGFQGTICKVHKKDYLISRINGDLQPDIQHAAASLEEVRKSLKPLLQRLHWKDFELLVDLIFSRSGWQRLSPLGKTEKSIDLELILPVTGRRSFVQVKSQANLADLKQSVAHYRSMDQYEEMFFIVHTAGQSLQVYAKSENINLIGLEELSVLVVDFGLCSWLIQRVS